MNKGKRYFLIAVALVAVVLSQAACDEKNVQNDAYKAIQDGQSGIKEAGEAVREASNDTGLSEEVDLSAVSETVEKIEVAAHEACLKTCDACFGPEGALENADSLALCLDQCGDK